MLMPVGGIEVAMRVGVPRTVLVHMLVLVEYDLQAPPKCIGDAAQGLYARDVIATFEARDHGLRHAQPLGKLLLGLARVSAKLQQPLCALRRKRLTIVEERAPRAAQIGCHHRQIVPSLICEDT
jgi:hypothetical protein